MDVMGNYKWDCLEMPVWEEGLVDAQVAVCDRYSCLA